MQYYDLNLSPKNNFSNMLPEEAFCSFISSEVVWVNPENASKQLDLQYDKTHQILKIIHHNFSIKLTDFTDYTYLPVHFYIPFQVAVASLVSANYSINIISKNGSFHPAITQKIGIKDYLLNAYVIYDEKPIKQITFTRLNNYLLNVNNDDNDTTIILFPVTEDDLAFIKGCFSFLYPWKETIPSKVGRILIPPKKERGGIFFNGKICSEFNSHDDKALLYSYELNNADFGINGNATAKTTEIPLIVEAILKGLSATDKKKIFPTFVNNYDSLEWSFPNIQELVLKYLVSAFPDKYVYYSFDDIELVANYIELAKKNKKEIVQLDDATYWAMKNSKQDIFSWVQLYLADKYNDNFINDKLNANELHNLNILEKFCNYFVSQYEPFKELLAELKTSNLKFYVVKDCLVPTGIFSIWLKGCIIDKNNLKVMADAFATTYKILQQLPVADDDFAFTWIKAMTQFLAKSNLIDDNKDK